MGILRLWLALAVVSTHYYGPIFGYSFIKGGDAVAAFFILAGFFAAFMIDTRYRGRYQVFYVNRLLRVWPAYLLVLLATLGLMLLGLLGSHVLLGTSQHLIKIQNFPGHAWISAWGIGQIFLIGQDLWSFLFLLGSGAVSIGCTQPGFLLSNLSLLPQAWSLALEEYFYLLAPWLEKLSLKVSAGIFAAWLLAYAPLSRLCDRLPMYFFPLSIALFIGGIFAYRSYQLWQAHPELLKKWRPWVLAAYSFFILGAAYHEANQAFIALATALSVPFVFDAFRGKSWDRTVGDLSYPVYLLHVLVQWASGYFWPALSGSRESMMGVTLLAAAGMAFIIEKPLRKYREKLAGT